MDALKGCEGESRRGEALRERGSETANPLGKNPVEVHSGADG